MAKKKTDTRADIINAYMEYTLDHGRRPKNIYSFIKGLDIKEAEFYDHFTTFKSIEKSIFSAFFENTLTLLDKNQEFHSFDARNKLISFYFTFFEVLKANRSYVVFALDGEKNKLKVLASLSGLKKLFCKFIEDIDIETIDFKQDTINKVKNQGLKEGAWGQLLFTMKFWLDDESKGFEKTDIFIEKSISTSFSLLNNPVLNEVIDLGKFIFKEKIKTS